MTCPQCLRTVAFARPFSDAETSPHACPHGTVCDGFPFDVELLVLEYDGDLEVIGHAVSACAWCAAARLHEAGVEIAGQPHWRTLAGVVS